MFINKIKLTLKKIIHSLTYHVPVILQLSETECGIATLAMIFAYHQANISLEKLRGKCGVSRDGSKAVTLINVARSYGFEANAYKTDIESLNEFDLPVIAYWNFNHYVVIKKITANKVLINDPGQGALAVSMSEFDKAFTGVIIDINATQESVKIKKESNYFQIIKQWFSGWYVELFFLFICSLVMISIPYLNSALVNVFIDYCVISKNTNWIPYIVLLIGISASILISATLLLKMIEFKLYSKAGIVRASETILHILQLPMLFYSLRQRSEIVSILSKTEYIINLLFKNSLSFTVGSIASVLCLIGMFKMNASLSCISLIMTLLSFAIIYLLSKINFSYEKSNINTVGKLYSQSVTTLKNIETVKACGLENRMLKKWHQLFLNKIAVQDKIFSLAILGQSLTKSYYSLCTLSLLCCGGYQVSKGDISIGNLLGYYSLQLVFYTGLLSIFQAITSSQSAYAIQARINDIVLYEKDKRYAPSQYKHEAAACSSEAIVLTNVTFFYNINSLPVLKNIHLSVMKGQHIALVGGTGSGKSTLSKLMCAFYHPNFGELELFGKLLSFYTAEELAKTCAYVSQEISLFTGTIYQNITLGKGEVSLAKLNQCINDACLNSLIKERGLHATVEEEGRNFSGGERQRIDIARALFQDTPVLILDEATSALDIKTEIQLIHNLRNTDKTIVFVAHRLSTVQHCDKIYVMRAGEIIEYGKHEKLITNKNYYHSLIKNEISLPCEEKLC